MIMEPIELNGNMPDIVLPRDKNNRLAEVHIYIKENELRTQFMAGSNIYSDHISTYSFSRHLDESEVTKFICCLEFIRWLELTDDNVYVKWKKAILDWKADQQLLGGEYVNF